MIRYHLPFYSLQWKDTKANQLKYLWLIIFLKQFLGFMLIGERMCNSYAVNVQVLAAILGREVGPVPTIYLGYVDGFQIWNSVLKRCEKWLAIWKSET